MSDKRISLNGRIGYLLLRDGHSVPLAGAAPEDIKFGARRLVPHPAVTPPAYRRALTAIVDRLGFRGDHGDYLKSGWPSFQAFLEKHGCTHRAGLFPVDHQGCIDLFFTAASGPRPRQLADRIFESSLPVPAAVFLGYGVDWAAWDSGGGHAAPEQAVALVRGDASTAIDRAAELFRRRIDLIGQWGFLDDKLIAGPVERVVDKTYWESDSSHAKRAENLQRVREAVLAFRAVFDAQREGWVDVLPFNDRLVVLRAHDGGWDVLWRGYREAEPIRTNPAAARDASTVALPHHDARAKTDGRSALDDRQDVWDELEAHLAEQAFYDRGGDQFGRRFTPDSELRAAWLRETSPTPRVDNGRSE